MWAQFNLIYFNLKFSPQKKSFESITSNSTSFVPWMQKNSPKNKTLRIWNGEAPPKPIITLGQGAMWAH